jgi:PST family polysaccharide transporter
MIYGLLGSVLTSVILSHLLSDRRWGLAWERSVAREAFRYGRPLIPNGIANAVNVMGDRFIVGSYLGVSALALYNVAMTMAVLPRGALLKVLNSFFLPVFVNNGTDKARQRRLYDLWALCLATIGLAAGIGLISIGRPMVGLVFGSVYQPSALLMSLISIDVCIKFLAGLPVPPSLAYGQTRFVLWGSIANCLAVVFAGVLLPRLPSIEGFVAALALGEFLALMWIAWRTLRIHGFTPSSTWFAVLFPIAILSGLALLRAELPDLSLAAWIAVTWTIGVIGIATLIDVMSLVRTRVAVRGLRPDAAPAE